MQTRYKTLPKYLSPQLMNKEVCICVYFRFDANVFIFTNLFSLALLQLTIHSSSDQNSDNLINYPRKLSPQSLPPQYFMSDDDLPCYDHCDTHDSLILTADYQAISPPAEYAEGSCNSPSVENAEGSCNLPSAEYQKRRYSVSNR